MKLLIIGGAGFMGSAFVRYFIKNYNDVFIVNFDKLSYSGNLDNLLEIKNYKNYKNYKFIKGDILNKFQLEEVVKTYIPDVIINYAAETHVDKSILEPEIFVKTDVLGVLNILEIVKKHKISKFIQISTDEVYGDILKGRFTEQSPILPNSPYSASKASADILIRAYFKTYSVPAIITRSCNVYGPYQYPEKFIPFSITNLLLGDYIYIYGDGKQKREWIWVYDHVKAIEVILEKGKIGEIYNISSGEEKENLEIAKLILKNLGFSEEKIKFTKDRKAHDKRYALEWNKIRDLGYKPKVKLTKGLLDTITWYKKNDWWWRKLRVSEEFKKYFEKFKKLYL